MRVSSEFRISWFDKFLLGVAPGWGQRRIEARARVHSFARSYDAAKFGRRTGGWRRSSSDANVANGPHLGVLRDLSRDLRRNNGWARRGIQVIVNNTVGWGIMPKPKANPNRATMRRDHAFDLWNQWADSTACDFDGRLSFCGIQRLAMETIAEAGEVLILKQPATTDDGLPIPLRLQVLEPDYLDSTKNGQLEAGGKIIDGVEFDERGQRVAYWLYSSHPGGRSVVRNASVRHPASSVLHIYRVDRPGQVRGMPWLAPVIARLKDLDDFEDAELMQQKVAACFGAFVTDLDGTGTPVLGPGGVDRNSNPIESIEPGTVAYLKPGQNVQFATPPSTSDSAFTTRSLRLVAAGLGIPYEELGDYSQVNFSSARMSRLAHWQNVSEWREHMLIPMLCDGVWRWAMQLVMGMKDWTKAPVAEWAAPPMPILEPDKEGLAWQRLIRIGARTWPQMVRELGYDPSAQLAEIKEYNEAFDDLGITFDSDPRRTNASGQRQGQGELPAGKADETSDDEDKETDEDEGDDAEDGAAH